MMEQGVTFIVMLLDQVRISALRWTLPSNLLRSIFLNRALRLQVLFLVAAVIYLLASIFFPLWVLVIGPILWGIPHIFSSIRYLPKSISLKSLKAPKLAHVLFGMWAFVTCLRVLTDQLHVQLSPSFIPENWPELIAAVATLLLIGFASRSNWRRWILGMMVLGPLVLASWFQPFATAGVLILLHNWIAFIYWYRSARSSQEKLVVGFSLFIFTAVNLGFYFGSFDFLYQYFTPQGYHQFAQLDYSDLGKMIAPGSTDHRLWFHLVSMYAFGQALHYFIWLKAIPDQELPREFPVSFNSTWNYLKVDFGPRVIRWIGLVVVTSLGAWLFFRLPQARAIYFSVAAFHGYMELAGLGFLKFDKIKA